MILTLPQATTAEKDAVLAALKPKVYAYLAGDRDGVMLMSATVFLTFPKATFQEFQAALTALTADVVTFETRAPPPLVICLYCLN